MSETANSVTSKEIVIKTTDHKRNTVKSRTVVSAIPAEIENDPLLLHKLESLPKNYNFEIKKSIWRIQQSRAKHVCLQFPEGLMVFSTVIADILEAWTG